jgi:hypothetical protein
LPTFAVEGADPVQIVAAGKAAKANADLVAQLQTENAGLKTQLQTQTAAQKKAASEAWIDGEIAKKRAIPAKDRDFFVTLHMERPDAAVRAVEAIGLLGETHTQKTPVEGGLKAELSAEQLAVRRPCGPEFQRSGAPTLNLSFFVQEKGCSAASVADVSGDSLSRQGVFACR